MQPRTPNFSFRSLSPLPPTSRGSTPAVAFRGHEEAPRRRGGAARGAEARGGRPQQEDGGRRVRARGVRRALRCCGRAAPRRREREVRFLRGVRQPWEREVRFLRGVRRPRLLPRRRGVPGPDARPARRGAVRRRRRGGAAAGARGLDRGDGAVLRADGRRGDLRRRPPAPAAAVTRTSALPRRWCGAGAAVLGPQARSARRAGADRVRGRARHLLGGRAGAGRAGPRHQGRVPQAVRAVGA
uniref:Uncharacterized protein n=1 Tax=Setaria viridis TaxID=4556 RepID=A0A4U6UAI7_SETVI|nr:hypothetical protein SEVIR_5G065420v2 [Setaria viridis]